MVKKENLKDVEAAWELFGYLEKSVEENYMDRDNDYLKQRYGLDCLEIDLRQIEAMSKSMTIKRDYLDFVMEKMAHMERKVFEYKALQATV